MKGLLLGVSITVQLVLVSSLAKHLVSMYNMIFLTPEVHLSPSDSVSTIAEGDDAMVCIRSVYSNGSLQRDIEVVVKTISTQTSTGECWLNCRGTNKLNF